jgi:hypothetical protein
VVPPLPSDLDPKAEAAFYRGLSAADRARLLAAACRAGARMLRSRPDAQRIAEFVDPLPESSIRALAHLRAIAAARQQAQPPTSRRGRP